MQVPAGREEPAGAGDDGHPQRRVVAQACKGGLQGPAGLPPEVAARLSAAIQTVVHGAEFTEKLKELNIGFKWGGPAACTEAIRQDLEKNRRAVKLAGGVARMAKGKGSYAGVGTPWVALSFGACAAATRYSGALGANCRHSTCSPLPPAVTS